MRLTKSSFFCSYQSVYLIFLTILGVVIALASLFLKSKGKAIGARPDYIACESILTKTELEFFKALNSILKKSEVLVCKVRQADIIKPNCNRSEPIYRTLFNKISQKHVDFVICDALTFKPLAIVELNDNSHKRKDRAKRD